MKLSVKLLHVFVQRLDHPLSTKRSSWLQDLRMPVHTRHQTKANCSSDGFGHLPLVHRSQSCVLGMLDPAHLGHKLRHHGEILAASVERP